MTRRLRPAVCLAIVAACGLAPSGAEAITIGVPNLNPTTGAGITCSGPAGTMCSLAQTSPPLAAPFDGVLTRWRVRVFGGNGTAQLRILRPQGAALTWLTTPGPAESVAPPNAAGEPLVHVFEMHAPMQRGDQIGVTIQDVILMTQGPAEGFAGINTSVWKPPPADGTSPPPIGALTDLAVGINADIERDNDSDTLGDETQDSDDDNDGTADGSDNCPTSAGASQFDGDGDGAGDLCDADDDNDGLPDASELALGSNPANSDTDADGKPDGTDPCVLQAGPTGCPAKPLAATLALKVPRRLTLRAFTRGVKVKVTPDQGVALRLALVAPGRGKGTILAEKSLPFAEGARSVRMKPSRGAAAGVRSVRLRVLAINAAGAQTSLRRTIRIRR